jgi:ferredoxin-NADP reductase
MTTAWKATRGTVARRLFLERQARFWAQRLDARWAPDELRARVVDVVAETGDTKTFLLRANRRWQGHRAGQYTTVEVEIDGVRHRRCYSLSSAPSDPLLRITVKRAPAGRVSSWLHDHLRRGDVVRLSPAAGDFVLDEPAPPRLLLLSGGSGITPVMSILRDLDERDAIGDVVFVHHARSKQDVIFGTTLAALAARHRGLRLVMCLDDDPTGAGRFDEARLVARVPDFAERTTLLCGPPGLMARVERMWDEAGVAHRLRRERFVAPVAAPPADADAGALTVRLGRSGRTHAADGAGTLLEQLERAGERPPHGCRIGICHTCKCTKRTGTVRNLLTGAVSSAPDEEIQLCVSVPCSDLELGL